MTAARRDSAGRDVDDDLGPDDLAPDECWLRVDDSGVWRCRRWHRPPHGGHAVIVSREAAARVLGIDPHDKCLDDG